MGVLLLLFTVKYSMVKLKFSACLRNYWTEVSKMGAVKECCQILNFFILVLPTLLRVILIKYINFDFKANTLVRPSAAS